MQTSLVPDCLTHQTTLYSRLFESLCQDGRSFKHNVLTFLKAIGWNAPWKTSDMRSLRYPPLLSEYSIIQYIYSTVRTLSCTPRRIQYHSKPWTVEFKGIRSGRQANIHKHGQVLDDFSYESCKAGVQLRFLRGLAWWQSSP